MKLREILHKIHAEKIHITDRMTGKTVTVDGIAPDSLKTVQRFLHCDVSKIEMTGNDARVTIE